MTKSLKELTWNASEEEYRDSEALHYSQIAHFKRDGIKCIEHLKDKIESESLTFGSVVDCMITEPEEFNNRFCICKPVSITDGGKKTLMQLLENGYGDIEEFSDIPQEAVSNAAIEAGFYVNSKYDKTRYVSVLATGNVSEYWKIIREKTKKAISYEMYEQAVQCVNAMRHCDMMSDIFYNENSNVEILYQPKFKTIINGIPYTCMFDALVIDHDNKTIYPKDVKTTSKREDEFAMSYCQFNYDLQANLYRRVLQNIINNDEFFKDYTIEEFEFYVVNRTNPHPLVWKSNVNIGDSFPYGNGVYEISDPVVLGEELWRYKNTEQYFDDTIYVDKCNGIFEKLNKNK